MKTQGAQVLDTEMELPLAGHPHLQILSSMTQGDTMPDRNLLQLSDRGVPQRLPTQNLQVWGWTERSRILTLEVRATLGLDRLWALNQLPNLSTSYLFYKGGRRNREEYWGCCDEIVPAESTCIYSRCSVNAAQYY